MKQTQKMCQFQKLVSIARLLYFTDVQVIVFTFCIYKVLTVIVSGPLFSLHSLICWVHRKEKNIVSMCGKTKIVSW